jgi:hypothetical protein
MKRITSSIILFLMCVFTAILSCGQDTPLAAYEPKSAQEQELKKTLLEFQDAVKAKNADKIKNLLSENASIMVGRERKILSKKEYVEILPERLAENPSISFGKPKMTVTGDKAEVRIYVARGDYNFLVVYDLQFENDKWYIHSWSY